MGGDDKVPALHKSDSSSLLLALEYLKSVKVTVMGGGIIISLLNSYNFQEIRVIERNFKKAYLTRRLKGVDVVMGGYRYGEQKEVAIAASELGMPFITYPLITTILPDGISFEDIKFPFGTNSVEGTIPDTLIRTLQVIELIKVFTGIGEPFFPPKARGVVFDPPTLDFKVTKMMLTVR